MDNPIKEIIDSINKGDFNKALSLCNINDENKIKHIIFNIKGVIFFKQSKFDLAKSNFLKSIELDNQFVDPYKNLYELHIKKQEFIQAITNGEKVIELEKQKNPMSYFKLAFAYDLNRNFNEAILNYKIVEKFNFPEKKLLLNNLGSCYLGINKLKIAEDYYLKALEIDRNDKRIINNLLLIYLKIGDQKNIEIFYKQAELADSEFIQFKLNKSDYLFSINKINESIEYLKKIIDNSENPLAYMRLASIFSRIGDDSKSIEIINKAFNKYPNFNEIKAFKGMMHLKRGEFDEGWKLYEFRKSKLKNIFDEIKIWNNENIKESKILVYNEQGIGDTIQFSKNLLRLSEVCKNIDFVVSDKLYPIFKKKINNINICKKQDILRKRYDYKISIGSLNKNFYDNNKYNSSELIFSDENKKNIWKNKLNNKKINIGLVWSGNFFGPKEPFRSIELKKFSDILNLNINFYCLQSEIWDRDKLFFNNSKIIDYSKYDFEEISAIIPNLDLVISSDTSILHLSCVLKKETWGLLSLDSDWRWFEYYKLNPYENLKLYKQSEFNNWESVLKNLEKDLISRFKLEF